MFQSCIKFPQLLFVLICFCYIKNVTSQEIECTDDISKRCEHWANIGYCKSGLFKAFMVRYCCKSCKDAPAITERPKSLRMSTTMEPPKDLKSVRNDSGDEKPNMEKVEELVEKCEKENLQLNLNISTLTATLEETTINNTVLKSSNEQCETELQTSQSSNEQCETEVQASQSSNEQCETELQATQSSNEHCETELQALKSSNEQCETENQALKSSNGQLISNLRTTQQQLQSTKTSNEQCETEVQALQSSNRRLETELQTIKNQLRASQQQLQYAKESSYSIVRTPRQGTFEEARQMCIQLGGRLLQRTLIKTGGKSYIGIMQALIPTKTAPNSRCWIGMHDRNVEGRWEFLDFTDSTSDLVVAWYPDNPNNAGWNEHCGEIINYQLRSIAINDIPCSSSFYGCCEVKV